MLKLRLSVFVARVDRWVLEKRWLDAHHSSEPSPVVLLTTTIFWRSIVLAYVVAFGVEVGRFIVGCGTHDPNLGIALNRGGRRASWILVVCCFRDNWRFVVFFWTEWIWYFLAAVRGWSTKLSLYLAIGVWYSNSFMYLVVFRCISRFGHHWFDVFSTRVWINRSFFLRAAAKHSFLPYLYSILFFK